MIIRSILVAIDFDEPSAHILEFARMVADASHASLHVLHVVGDPLGGPGALDVDLKTTRQRLENLLDASDRDARHAICSCESGTPAHEIVQYASDHSIDLIVMGTHSHGPTYHLPFGSVAESVLRFAPCAVLAVKGGEAAAAVPVRTSVATARGDP